ncbi:hypothetical protein C2E23DRAFT_34256 [Lenzites betulinus]|nr:hypothetical protein C2E23DRAFT_34256 [Lenzites betulinus]
MCITFSIICEELTLMTNLQSFLNAIQRCVSGPRESLDSSAPCLYFALRTPGSTLKENWMAINNWPLTKVPRWSRKIAVIPSEGDSTKYDHWKVKLVGMAIVKKGANRQAETIPNGNLPISESAHDLSQCNVLLDTGSSLSYVPDRIIAHLRALFPCSENTTPSDQVMPAEAAAATTSGTSVTTNLTLPFVVPNSVQSSSKPLWIEYKFMGMTAGDTVTVYGPVDPFLCCRNPHIPKQRFKEGLLWPFSTIPNRQDSSFDMIFGLNFFHSMFVALHCGTTTTKPYVELDDQVQGSEMNEYKLPPVSEEE